MSQPDRHFLYLTLRVVTDHNLQIIQKNPSVKDIPGVEYHEK